MIERIAIRKSN